MAGRSRARNSISCCRPGSASRRRGICSRHTGSPSCMCRRIPIGARLTSALPAAGRRRSPACTGNGDGGVHRPRGARVLSLPARLLRLLRRLHQPVPAAVAARGGQRKRLQPRGDERSWSISSAWCRASRSITENPPDASRDADPRAISHSLADGVDADVAFAEDGYLIHRLIREADFTGQLPIVFGSTWEASSPASSSAAGRNRLPEHRRSRAVAQLCRIPGRARADRADLHHRGARQHRGLTPRRAPGRVPKRRRNQCRDPCRHGRRRRQLSTST